MKTKPFSGTVVISPRVHIPMSELRFTFSRSGGPGGQNVNKVESRVTLEFSVAESPSLTGDQKRKILQALRSRIDSSGTLRVAVDDSRSQWKNREAAVERFTALLQKAVKSVKKRLPTKATGISRERRLMSKKLQSAKKTARRQVDPE